MAAVEVPAWGWAALGAIGLQVIKTGADMLLKRTRSSDEQAKDDTTLLSTALNENRSLRAEFEPLWRKIRECEANHAESKRRHRECEDRNKDLAKRQHALETLLVDKGVVEKQELPVKPVSIVELEEFEDDESCAA